VPYSPFWPSAIQAEAKERRGAPLFFLNLRLKKPASRPPFFILILLTIKVRKRRSLPFGRVPYRQRQRRAQDIQRRGRPCFARRARRAKREAATCLIFLVLICIINLRIKRCGVPAFSFLIK